MSEVLLSITAEQQVRKGEAFPALVEPVEGDAAVSRDATRATRRAGSGRDDR